MVRWCGDTVMQRAVPTPYHRIAVPPVLFFKEVKNIKKMRRYSRKMDYFLYFCAQI